MRYALATFAAFLPVLATVAVAQDGDKPRPADKPPAAKAAAPEDALAKVRAILDGQREKQHIPGLAFVVVKDDKVWCLETRGLRDRERQLPVTPDTLFPIGSCTKSFTAVAAAVCDEQGVLSLDDSPHKYLPYLHLADPEANELITLRDMLCHRTGLRAYADLAAEPAVLSREEYVRAATSAKPAAKFRAKFQYSNAMFTAAGEALGRANRTTWERVIEDRIFAPLHMSASLTSAESIVGKPDHALGYDYRAARKDWKPVPTPKSLATLAPAGAIASTARDMGQWLRFLTAGGTIDGKRVVSEAMLRDVTRPHVTISDTMSYDLGWVTYRWNGHVVVEHNGGSQGISAVVSYMPDRRVGFAFLANTSPNYMTGIGNAGRLLWPVLLGEEANPSPPASKPPAAAPPPAANPSPAPPLPAVDELLARMLAAQGGEKNLRRHTSMKLRARKVYENQGVQAEVAILARAPSSRSEEEKWTAAGKPIGTVRVFFDGSRGGQKTTFGQDSTLTGDEINSTRRESALHPILDLRQDYEEVKVDRKATVAGEDAYVLELTPKHGASVSLFVSSRTYLIIQRKSKGETTTYADYRNVDGEFVPFRTTSQDALGEETVEVLEIRFNEEVPPSAFQEPAGTP
jgi:CubicO group peptidase (beta-lactamase class C family)